MTSRCRLIDFPDHSDVRGRLVALEGGTDIPFAIERVYYIVETDGARRGFHAHRRLEQIMFCLNGSCRVLLDDGHQRDEVILDRPNRGLYVGPMIWREMNDFTPGSVFLVFASARFEEADYLRDHDEFVALAGEQGR